MNFDIIKPYMARLKRSKKEIRAFVYDEGSDIKNRLMDLKKGNDTLINQIVDDQGLELVVVGYDAIQDVNLLKEAWSRLDYDGWLFVADTPTNRERVFAFRKEAHITSIMTIIEGWIYFQLEDYRQRNKHTGNVKEADKKLLEDDWDVIPVPNWRDSHIKEEYLLKYGNGKVFIETGTYLGQAVEVARRSKVEFEKIYSIEINHNLAEKAKKIFDFDMRIKIIEGDSVDKLAELCSMLDQPAVFWLDAHASGPLPGGEYGPCPLVLELKAIKETGRKDHTIFIDDRRLMGSAEWGGVTEAEIMKAVSEIYEGTEVKVVYLDGEVENDVICITVVDRDVSEEKQPEHVLPENVRKYFDTGTKQKPKEKPKIVFLEM